MRSVNLDITWGGSCARVRDRFEFLLQQNIIHPRPPPTPSNLLFERSKEAFFIIYELKIENFFTLSTLSVELPRLEGEFLLWFALIVIFRLFFVFDFLFALFRMTFWSSAGKDLSSWLSA